MHTIWSNFHLAVPVAPDMTPLLQLTDSCQTAFAKRAAEKVKGKLETQLREKARRESAQYAARMGPYELFKVAQRMSDEGSRRQCKRDVVLGEAIKSQVLVIRPDLEAQTLVKIETEQWSEEFPRFLFQMGLQSNWVSQRFMT